MILPTGHANNMKRLIVISVGIILFILILIGVTLLESLKTPKPTEKDPQQPTKVISNGSAQKNQANYDSVAADKLVDIAKRRPTPNQPSDLTIRSSLIGALNNQSGTILDTQTYRLEYLKSPNSFEVEIKTTEISRAKNEVIDFLKSKGLTEDGICKLPLMFYLSFDVSKSIGNESESFKPIPDFCL